MKTHFSFKHLLFIGGAVLYSMQISAVKNPVDYVSTLVGTQSKFELSTGNTYPATALPWGMNFWTPQTGKMGDGWAYTYNADKIRGFKQTHQPSPWMNDYGQFSIIRSQADWYSTRTNVPAGSRTRRRLPNLIIIRYISQTTTLLRNSFRRSVPLCSVSRIRKPRTLMSLSTHSTKALM